MIDEKIMKDVLKLHKQSYYESKGYEPINQMRMLYNYVQNLRMVEHLKNNRDGELKYYHCTQKIMDNIIEWEAIDDSDKNKKNLMDKKLKQVIKEIEIEFDFV
jgi:hypothetical protein